MSDTAVGLVVFAVIVIAVLFFGAVLLEGWPGKKRR